MLRTFMHATQLSMHTVISRCVQGGDRERATHTTQSSVHSESGGDRHTAAGRRELKPNRGAQLAGLQSAPIVRSDPRRNASRAAVLATLPSAAPEPISACGGMCAAAALTRRSCHGFRPCLFSAGLCASCLYVLASYMHYSMRYHVTPPHIRVGSLGARGRITERILTCRRPQTARRVLAVSVRPPPSRECREEMIRPPRHSPCLYSRVCHIA